MEFEWDPKKNEANIRKHGVAFSEAATVFSDVLSMTVPDPDHSQEEDRYIIIGLSGQNRPVMVAHMERGECIRIISARELTRSEKRNYEENRQK